MGNVSEILQAALRHHNEGNFLDAERGYRHALALDPRNAGAHNNLGIVLHGLGRSAEAEQCYRQALALQPDYADAHCNYGNVMQSCGRLEEAESSYRKALALKPDFPEALNNLGNTMQGQGRLEDAVLSYRRAIALRPDYAIAHCNLGDALCRRNLLDEAYASYRQVLQLDPNSVQGGVSLGILLHGGGLSQEARKLFERVLEANPEHLIARWALTMAQCQLIYTSEAETEACRAAFAREFSALEEWLDSGRVKDATDAVGVMQPFYLAYQERNNAAQLSRYGSLCSRLMRRWQTERGLAPARHAPGGVVRVGIVSAHIREHSVWNALVKGWLQFVDRSRFSIHVFSLVPDRDHETEFAQREAAHFESGGVNAPKWANSIASHRLDALIYPEIGMDPLTIKLASLRLAPVQIATWGHPETTGLPTVDYFLSADDIEPPNAKDHYTEQLVQLPHLGCCYQMGSVAPMEPDWAALGIDRRLPLLVCAGTPFKYAPQHDHLLVEIARKLGRCQLVFFNHPRKTLSDKLRERLANAYSMAGMRSEDHVLFVPWQTQPYFRGLLRSSHVFLDTIGFSGFNTAMQAIECSLPIVTLEGRFMRGRLAAGILRRIGLHELVVQSATDYVALAVGLASDTVYRKLMVSRIESARQALYDDRSPIRALEQFLVEAVRRDSP